MIYQLLAVSRQTGRLSAQIERAKERAKERKSEKDSIQSEESTSAFTNMVENRVEEFLSLVFAMAPQEQTDEKTNSTSSARCYADWLRYLQKQFLALSHIDENLPEGSHRIVCCCDETATPSDDDNFFIELLNVAENESQHIDIEPRSDTVGIYTASIDQIRALLLFRIQTCLLSRAVTGVFLQHVPFQTDHSATLSAVATGRFLAAHCTNALRNLHDAESVGKKPATYGDLLQIMSCNNRVLDSAVALPKSRFPMQYTKKASNAFKTELVALIDEFDKFYKSLSKGEQDAFRKRSLSITESNSSSTTRKRFISRRATKSRKAKKDDDDDGDDDDNDDDGDDQDDEDDEQAKHVKKKICPMLLPSLQPIEPAQQSIFSTTSTTNTSTTNFMETFRDDHGTGFSRTMSHFASPSSMLGLGDDAIFSATFARHALQSPRLTHAARNLHLDEETDATHAQVQSCDCKSLRQTVSDLRQQIDALKVAADHSSVDMTNFFADANDFATTSKHMEQQLSLAQDQNAEQEQMFHSEMAAERQKNANRIQELEQREKQAALRIAELESALQESQRLQISTQNARAVAERDLAKISAKKPQKTNTTCFLSDISRHWLLSL